jgi:hypothetical protein
VCFVFWRMKLQSVLAANLTRRIDRSTWLFDRASYLSTMLCAHLCGVGLRWMDLLDEDADMFAPLSYVTAYVLPLPGSRPCPLAEGAMKPRDSAAQMSSNCTPTDQGTRAEARWSKIGLVRRSMFASVNRATRIRDQSSFYPYSSRLST